jgi:hypothetical protein
VDRDHRAAHEAEVSRTTFTIGTRQFVVHDALEMIVCLAGSYFVSFTPITIGDVLALGGRGDDHLLRAAVDVLPCVAAFVKRPVDSSTTSTPRSLHGSFDGSFSAKT